MVRLKTEEGGGHLPYPRLLSPSNSILELCLWHLKPSLCPMRQGQECGLLRLHLARCWGAGGSHMTRGMHPGVGRQGETAFLKSHGLEVSYIFAPACIPVPQIFEHTLGTRQQQIKGHIWCQSIFFFFELDLDILYRKQC